MEMVAAFTTVLCIFAVGDFVAIKTKALLSAMLAAALILLIGFWCGLNPDIMNISAINQTSGLVVGFALTSMGTLIDLDELIRQWKTVLIGFSAAILIVVLIVLVGPLVIDRSQAIASSSIVAGGVVANLVVQETIAGKGMIDVEILCILTLVLQNLVGIPVTSLVLRKEAKRFIDSGDYKLIDTKASSLNNNTSKKKKLIPQLPDQYCKPTIILAKVGLVTTLSYFITNLTGGKVSALLVCMIMGVIAHAIGFLEKDALTKANSFGLVMFFITAFIFSNLYQVTPELLLKTLLPLIVVLSLGIIAIIISGLIIGKVLNVAPMMAIAIGLTALYGFPATFLLANEVSEAIGEDDVQVAALKDYIIPKMVTAGFATVTIASVVIVGFVVPLL